MLLGFPRPVPLDLRRRPLSQLSHLRGVLSLCEINYKLAGQAGTCTKLSG